MNNRGVAAVHLSLLACSNGRDRNPMAPRFLVHGVLLNSGTLITLISQVKAGLQTLEMELAQVAAGTGGQQSLPAVHYHSAPPSALASPPDNRKVPCEWIVGHGNSVSASASVVVCVEIAAVGRMSARSRGY